LLGAALATSFAAAQSDNGQPASTAPVSGLRATPAETTAAAVVDPHWQVPRTSWGQPSFEGVWSTDDLRSVPLNRPARFGTRDTLNEQEFRERAARDEAGRTGPGDFLQHEWGIRTFGYTSLVIDPPSGQTPALTPAG
jgi:hypothetical protein